MLFSENVIQFIDFSKLLIQTRFFSHAYLTTAEDFVNNFNQVGAYFIKNNIVIEV